MYKSLAYKKSFDMQTIPCILLCYVSPASNKRQEALCFWIICLSVVTFISHLLKIIQYLIRMYIHIYT